MLSQRKLSELTGLARSVALQAGEIIKKKSHQRHRVSFKGRVDLVTEVDLLSERFIVGEITKRYPKHAILAEEGSDNNIESDIKWIIDPIDGTTNYAHGFPFYCVSIGIEYEGEMVAGAIYDPEREELFYAFQGSGAFLNKKRIIVSSESNLQKSLLATGFPYDIKTSRIDNLKYFRRFAKVARGIRRAGSAALDLCYLACGRFDGFWELKLHPWDTAATVVIVREAGGNVTNFSGEKYSIYGNNILATNGKIHSQMSEMLLWK
ncbi:MAG: inositol monophosphatase family protein [Candidatus Zixiibacteriota bacterium]